VIPVGEDASAAACHTIDGARETRAERYHAASERIGVLGFYDEMRVIAL